VLKALLVQRPTLGQTAFACLILGAVGIAFAPLFVRWSEVGPSATAFYRLLLALPFLGVGNAWLAREPNKQAGGRPDWRLILPGLFFAGDLALWHWSIRFTSVANATLFANFAPILVTLGAWMMFHERITLRFAVGLGLALGGAGLVVSSSFRLAPGHVTGDLLGVATALFYAAYLLSVKQARGRHSTARVMLWTSLTGCPVLWGLAALSHERLIPSDTAGWVTLLALALVSQVGGQGLIACALAHLPASFSSVSLLVQPVVAALLAALILHEGLRPLQVAGGLVVLAGIAVASRARPEAGLNRRHSETATAATETMLRSAKRRDESSW
jgi:drug/metabolite transporter (DMT)-like permease